MIAAADAKGKAVKAAAEQKAQLGSKAQPTATEATVVPISDGITASQVTLLGKLMKEKSVELGDLTDMVGRTVTSVKDLTKREASKAISQIMGKE